MKKIDVLIIGGGLAGLTAAVHLSSKHLKIGVIEKEKFPHHKVCGEYLSKEIVPYLETIGLDLNELVPAEISQLEYSTPTGKIIHSNLEMGGLGISRFALDHYFYKKALETGCSIIQDTVTKIEYKSDNFRVQTAGGKLFTSKFVLGAYGKRSNLDKNLNRNFIKRKSGWLAIKAHYELDSYPNNLVSLHNFKGGYCGLSKTETNAVNVCFLATYNSFKKHRNPEEYINSVLKKNPELNQFFTNARPIFEKKLSIAQISFNKKSIVNQHILMLGDAAGLIHPLCGNGMAMAIHSGKIASEGIMKYFNEHKYSRIEVENFYKINWDANFRSRLATGRYLQKILLNSRLAEFSQFLLSNIPSLLPIIIKKTHGKIVV